jgi:hypothetical protein
VTVIGQDRARPEVTHFGTAVAPNSADALSSRHRVVCYCRRCCSITFSRRVP